MVRLYEDHAVTAPVSGTTPNTTGRCPTCMDSLLWRSPREAKVVAPPIPGSDRATGQGCRHLSGGMTVPVVPNAFPARAVTQCEALESDRVRG